MKARIAARTPAGDRLSYYADAYEDDVARRKIEDEFEHAIRGLPMMATLPFVPSPDMRTEGSLGQAEATRPSDSESISDHTKVDSGNRFESWLMQAVQAPRLAATGPVPCKPPVAPDTNP